MIDKNSGALGINCISAPAAGHSRKSLRTTFDTQGPEITGLERLDWPVSKNTRAKVTLLLMGKSSFVPLNWKNWNGRDLLWELSQELLYVCK